MPHLFCLANYFRTHGGGVEQMAHNLADTFTRELGWDVTLAAHGTPEGNTSYLTEGIRVANIVEQLTGIPIPVPHPSDLLRALRKAELADVVLLHDCIYASTYFALRKLAANKPIVVVKHTGKIQTGNKFGTTLINAIADSMLNPKLNMAAATVFVTEAKRQNFGRRISGHVEVIPNGIEDRIFFPDSSKKKDSVLFVGRLVDKKGINIIREMAKICSSKKFVIVGFGPENPNNWDLANVKFYKNPDSGFLANIYRQASKLLLPGEMEGTPLVALEALACGTPVVAGESARPPDAQLEEQMTFLPVNLGDPHATAKHWLTFLKNACLPNPDSSMIRKRYGQLRMANDYAKLFSRIAPLS